MADTPRKVPLVEIHLKGGEYDLVHGISLERLASFRGLQTAIYGAARDMWQVDHPDQKRRDFNITNKELELRLTRLWEASAASMVEAVIHPPAPARRGRRKTEEGRTQVAQDMERYRVRGVQELDLAVRAAANRPDDDEVLSPALSKDCYEGLVRWLGELLEEDGAYANVSFTHGAPIRVDRRAVRRLQREAERPPVFVREAMYLVGRVSRVDVKDAEEGITMLRREGDDPIRLPLPRDSVRPFADALDHESASALLRVRCTALRDLAGRLKMIESTDRAEGWLGGPALEPRFNALRNLIDRWPSEYDASARPPKYMLDQARPMIWDVIERTGLDRPHIYITDLGRVQAEWGNPSDKFSIAITVHSRSAVHVRTCGHYPGRPLRWSEETIERPGEVDEQAPIVLWAGKLAARLLIDAISSMAGGAE